MCTKNILPTGRLETQADDQVQCLAKIEVLQRKLAHVQGARLHLLGFPSPLDSIHVGVHLASDSIFPFFAPREAAREALSSHPDAANALYTTSVS